MRARVKQMAAAAIVIAALTGRAEAALDELSLEDLTKAEITSVARRSQNLANVPAAAFVVSAEDIRRSGALALPDVLRMVPGVEVAQVDSGRYAVSSRGFNGRFANKLQVLVDGRSVYHPIFSGVMWEHDVIPLEDIERIEVIRGPGAAMWGVNAVNGVINIISKHSRNQTGGLVAATVGTNGETSLYGRYGSASDTGSSWKLSAQGRHADPSDLASSGTASEDRLNNQLMNLRYDRKLDGGSDLALWFNATQTHLGDLMRLGMSPQPPLTLLPFPGMQRDASRAVAGRYRWLTGSGIESSLQASWDASTVEVEGFFKEDRDTYDLDYQGRRPYGAHDLLWGISHRTTAMTIGSVPSILSFRRSAFTQHSTGVFVQDDWTLVPDRLQVGLGARWDHTNLGGKTIAPNATLMWTPSRTDTIWAKYARAPRMPAQAEQDATVLTNVRPASPSSPLPILIRANPNDATLRAETIRGIELGYRTQASVNLNIDVSGYRYRYRDRVSGSLGAIDAISFFPFAVIQETNPCNCANGWLTGADLSADWLVSPVWRLQLAYSWTRIDMDGSSEQQTEKGTPRHYGSLRSQWNIGANRQFDAWLRGSAGYERANVPYTDLAHVPGYVTLDLRYAHKLDKNLELAVTGRNLIGGRRVEFISDYIPSIPVVVGPSVLFSARWKF
jgi:iron complex outermembrane receptor protein